MEEYPPVPKKNPILQFLLYGIEFLGGAFVALIVFALLLVILNYFNLLPISDAFPKYLGWLPRKDVSSGTSQTKNISLKNQSSTIFPIPQGPFQYDTKKAETLLIQYTKATIKPELLPAKIEIKQGLSAEGKTENVKYEFGWYFIDANGVTFATNLHYAKDTNVINDQEIFIQLPDSIMSDKTVNADLANTFTAKYLLHTTRIILPSDCSNNANKSYCQVFNIDSDGKRGYGLIIITQPIFKTLFSCFIPKESPDYTKTESCIIRQ